MNVSILGAGAWGTAVAIALAAKNHVLIWGRNQAAIADMQLQRQNTVYLPGIRLPENLQLTSDFSEAMHHVAADDSLLIIATSVSGLRPTLQACLPYQPHRVIWLCKGFEEGTQLLPHQVARNILGQGAAIGALSGPSFALEVAQGLPCALTIASASPELCQRVVQALHGNAIRVYSSDDVVGVEVGGAVKNILAIATGVADGLGLGLNARAALMTRGLAEISRLGVALGARVETLMGLTGVGDLILTCTGDLSRNRKVGLALAQGKNLDTIVSELGHVAEGVRCAQAVRTLAATLGVDMPITNAVAGVLFDGVPARDMIARLLARDSKQENH
ncbi:NAD(P)H-dependent glycerol-3-phosphate dehydrogenase [Undibacterium oligocarboniphilum]|uniref:Glycerol-3-phosphate dehydrogenase [NAD(P)+] n=1 Tax=Undibacterium oligocarboniphilum TaxID=666702 RepID=A0A850QCA0_9BURK|nr:NAD(P)H-dependent glycerol-3-phosphate dehydrogenase [Undibacterium oligocarboniphilum]MBC3870950.1 NAD(P)-dependent glycerol-3-phosphate dehydrogenase [Undibacterium oligocarboniphilum]NVO76427.1 NAD(P)-dependent glycerol-3-phosphate dehydrogenase [Undibacterium oligocarboniphilum]